MTAAAGSTRASMIHPLLSLLTVALLILGTGVPAIHGEPGGAAELLLGTGLSARSVGAFVDDFASRYVGAVAPGLVVSVVKDGSTVYVGGSGSADAATQASMSATTQVRAGGLAHLVTAAAVMQLRDQGRWAEDILDMPLDTLLPPGTFPHVAKSQGLGAAPSVRAALAHAGGWETRFSGLWAPRNRAAAANGTAALQGMPRRVRAAGAPPLAASEHAYVALAAAVQAATEQDFGEYAQDQLFAPLGMQMSTMRPTDESNSAMAKARDDGELLATSHVRPSTPAVSGFKPIDVIGTAMGATSLVTTATDFAQLLKVFTAAGKVNGNRVLTKEAVADILHVAYPAFPGAAAADAAGGGALAWFQTKVGGVSVHVCVGDGPGFTAGAMLVPDLKIGVFVAANADAPALREQFMAEFAQKFASSSKGALSTNAAGKKGKNGAAAAGGAGTGSSADLAPFVGTYKTVQSSATTYEAVAHLTSQIIVTVSGYTVTISRDASSAPLNSAFESVAAAGTSGASASSSVQLQVVRSTTLTSTADRREGPLVVLQSADGQHYAAIYPGGTDPNAPHFYLTTNALGQGVPTSYQPVGFGEAASFVVPAATAAFAVFSAYLAIWMVRGLLGAHSAPVAAAAAAAVTITGKDVAAVAEAELVQLAVAERLDSLTALTCIMHLAFFGLLTLGFYKQGGIAAVLALPRLPASLRLTFFGSFLCQIASVSLVTNLVQEARRHPPLQVLLSAIVAVMSVAMAVVMYQMRLWIFHV
ncbi:beta-lactamase/transpeptidase-like protein [Blastocladiella britannica]|nr:beta-lactamase/transpeptidase-like protein [Blastocladiella britannica]